MSFQNYFNYSSYSWATSYFRTGVSYEKSLIDLNDDGFLDLLLLGASYPGGAGASNVSQAGLLLWGDENGLFKVASASEFESPKTTHPRAVLYADFNSDGVLDIFVADHGWDTFPYPGGQNQLLLSQAGTWVIATEKLPQRTDYTHCTAVGDINGDGNLDIFLGNVSTAGTSYEASFLLGDGAGGFTENQAIVPKSLLSGKGLEYTRFYTSELSDLNGDGAPELLIGNSGDSDNAYKGSAIFWNQGGSFSDAHRTVLPNGIFGTNYEHVLDIDTADIDGDGEKEVLINFTLQDPRYVGWGLELLKKIDGQYVDISPTAFGNAGQYFEGTRGVDGGEPWVTWARLVDVNFDGSVDVLLSSMNQNWWESEGNSERPVLYLNDGFGHFETLRQSDVVDLSRTFENAFSGSPAGLSSNGVTWLNVSGNDGNFYFRQINETQLLPSPVNITGTERDDVIRGDARANVLMGGEGDDEIDGGAGIDTVTWDGLWGTYTISSDRGVFSVRSIQGVDGIDTLSNVERLAFSNKHLAIDLDGHAGQVAKLLGAVFGSESVGNAEYVGIGLNLLDAGMSYTDLAALAVSVTGYSSSTDVCNLLWENVIGTPATSADVAPFKAMLDSGQLGIGQLTTLAADTSFNTENIDLVGLAQTGLEYL